MPSLEAWAAGLNNVTSTTFSLCKQDTRLTQVAVGKLTHRLWEEATKYLSRVFLSSTSGKQRDGGRDAGEAEEDETQS